MNLTPILLATSLALSLALSAALPAQADLIAKRDAKLASQFLSNADWITDYDEAIAAAKKTGKPVFGYFTRSYSP